MILETCRSITNTKSTTAKCTLKSIPLPNCDDPLEGTIATLKCEPLYEEPGLSLNPTRICKDGTWDFPLSRCTAGQTQHNSNNIYNFFITINLYPNITAG